MAPNKHNGGDRGPWGPKQPNLEELLKRGQTKIKQVMPGGSGLPGSLMFLVIVVLAAIVAFYAFTFRVSPDELGVVMRFGKITQQEPPGLHFRMPYPIDEVRLPKVTRQNIIEIGMRAGVGTRAVTDVPQESLMLTGDENIVDVDFSVLWVIKPGGVSDYVFNIQNPEGTVKAVAESAMREVIGRSKIEPVLTGARQSIEGAVQELMQKTLDRYGAGIQVNQVQLLKVDPPAQVIDSFRDVQAAKSDAERASFAIELFAHACGELRAFIAHHIEERGLAEHPAQRGDQQGR